MEDYKKVDEEREDIIKEADKILTKIDKVFSENTLDLKNKEVILRRAFNENWFSDTLNWLLSPKGSHKMGVKFATEFLKSIAKVRSGSTEYTPRSKMLKWGKGKKGVSTSKFSLKNASSIREFYLAQSIKKNSNGARYCDLVFLDLDLDDGLFLLIENKLFTQNHSGQLEEYYNLVEKKFHRTKVREYVYLTLYGAKPKGDSPDLKHWVRLSWASDILSIINKLKQEKEHADIIQLRSILEWLSSLEKETHKDKENLVKDLRKLMIKVATVCLISELNRLSGDKTGFWKMGKPTDNRGIINHTSTPKRPLFVQLLSNFTITLQSKQSKKALFDKIIVPFGVHPDQIFNLIELTARDVYYYHFGSSTKLYLADKRRSSSSFTQQENISLHKILNYINKHQYELKIILASSNLTLDQE
jgi:hypothetical protein